MPTNPSARRTARRFHPRRALLLLATVLGCGGDKSVTGPAGEVPSPMTVAQAVARPNEVVTARIPGGAVPTGSFTGRLGTVPVSAGRLDDSTIAMPVPAVVPGTYELRLRVGGKLYAANLQVAEPVVVTSPDAYVDGAVGEVTAQLDALSARLTSTSVRLPSADSARAAATLASARADLDSARKLIAAATPEERAAIAAFLKANAAPLGIMLNADRGRGDVATTASVDTRLAGGMLNATAVTYCYSKADEPITSPEGCAAELRRTLRSYRFTVIGLAVVAVGADIAQANPLTGKAIGVAATLLIASQVKILVEDINTRLTLPMIAGLGTAIVRGMGGEELRGAAPFGGLLSASALGDVPTFTPGVARAFTLEAEYHTPATSDSDPIVELFASFTSAWDALRLLLGGSLPAATLPATPAARTTATVSSQYLALGALSPAGLRGTLTPAGDGFTLAFTMDGIGADHDITYQLRYTAPDGSPEVLTRTAVLKPVKYAVAEVVIGGTGTGNVSKGGTLQLGVVVRDSAQRTLTDRPVTWASSNTARARVDTTGKVTAVDTGTVTITATADGKSGSVQLRVTQPSVALVDLSPSPASVRLNDTLQLVATLKDSVGNVITGRAITWTSAAPAIAKVDTAGRVVGVAVGTTTVTAASGGKTGTVQVRVSDVPVASVTISPANAEVLKGASITMSATLKDSAGNVLVGRELRWSSLSPSRATIDSVTGVVIAVDSGTTLISATSEGKTAAVPLKVILAEAAVASVTLEPQNPTVEKGKTLQLVVTQRDSAGNVLAGRPVFWYVADTMKLTIAEGGLLTAKDTGWVGIAATAQNGKNATTSVHVVAPGFTWKSLSSSATSGGSGLGGLGICGFASTGELYCWGYNEEGNLGDGTTTNHLTPTRVSNPVGLTSIAMGRMSSCGLDASGKAYCWGRDLLDMANNTVVKNTTPVPVPGGLTFSSLTVGYAHACGIAGGQAYCWGTNGFEVALGNGSTASSATPVPVSYGNFESVWAMAGSFLTCGIYAGGQASCWGRGYLGDGGDISGRGSPQPVAGGISFRKFTGNEFSVCGLDTQGRTWCWGHNQYGQLGHADTSLIAKAPVQVPGVPAFVDIGGGWTSTCGLTAEGQLWCWGDNFAGQLGDGTMGPGSKLPAPVAGSLRFRSLAMNEASTCALTLADEAYCWGYNYFGILGDGTTVDRGTPAAVAHP